jgi:penicillin-insensitive murein endopeptidase
MLLTQTLAALAAAAVLMAPVSQAAARDAQASAPNPAAPAKELFGAKKLPASLKARSIGFYAKGCLAGAVALPINGATWQVMRLSRNRNWGHPELVSLLERLATKVPKVAGWHGLLVGDIAQPRGGPMMTGHASHQIGLDADVWLTPMPNRQLTPQEREDISATSMLASDKKDVDPAIWTRGHGAVIKAAAQEPEVERIFVNAAIKKALCREAGTDRGWLHKVRAYWGHHYNFHIRMRCPRGEAGCTGQPEPPASEGCGHELDWWFRDSVLNPKPPTTPPKPRPSMTLAQLPPECRQVLLAP